MDGSILPIARSTLPEAAAERLRALIIEGALAPGAKLNERELSDRLGLSRTPLREAFRVLAGEGLLRQLPNRGVQVATMTAEEVRHAFEVMAALEGLAGELAAERVTAADLADPHLPNVQCAAACPALPLEPQAREMGPGGGRTPGHAGGPCGARRHRAT